MSLNPKILATLEEFASRVSLAGVAKVAPRFAQEIAAQHPELDPQEIVDQIIAMKLGKKSGTSPEAD